MNIIKHMEAVFIVAVALVSVTSIASAGARAARIDPPAATKAVADANMTVVTVSAKRLTAAEKAALGN